MFLGQYRLKMVHVEIKKIILESMYVYTNNGDNTGPSIPSKKRRYTQGGGDGRASPGTFPIVP
jgi:hypothetical protein